MRTTRSMGAAVSGGDHDQRPLDEYSLKIDVTKLTLNEEFEADQFELEVPAGVTVQKLE